MTRHSDAMATPTLTPERPATPPAPAHPPEWAAERFFKTLGQAPAAAGRALTAASKLPLLGIIIRFFSSVVLGITLLVLLGAYIGVGSGLPSMRAHLEMTDLQFFDAWPMRILLALLAVNLTIVTLRRIPLTLYKLGVWTVHIGILTLIGGSVWYFSHKQEGSVRIFLHHSVDSYFDATERALYAFPIDKTGAVNPATSTMTPLPNLPIFYEHLASNHQPLDIALPAQTLEAVSPNLKGATLKIVGYYPAAEMETAWSPDPAAVNDANGDAPSPAVRVSMALEGISSGQWLLGKIPADRVLDAPGAPFGIEYLYHPTQERINELATEFTGPSGVIVHIPKLGITRTYTADPGATVKVEGTPYSLTFGDQVAMPLISKGYEGAMSNSLMVTVARTDAPGKTTTFNRMVLTRYPERSPDFITGPDGKQKRIQDRVDNDLQLDFEDASRDQFWIIDPLDRPMELIHRKAAGVGGGGDGSVERLPLSVGKPLQVKVSTVPMTVTVLERALGMIGSPFPSIIPPERRERSISAMDAMQNSVVEMEFRQGNTIRQHIYAPFSQFAQIGDPPEGRQPAVIDLPGVGQIGFLLSTVRRPLPSDVTLADFQAVKYPGAETSYENYISTLALKDKDTGLQHTLVAQLNDPAADHGLYYFQSAWDGDDHAPAGRRFSVIGVGNRPGIWVMVLGAILMISGIGYAFYIKPILLNLKKQSVAAWAKSRALE
jgi:hypothetical protein